MNEPTKYEAAVAQMLLENKLAQEEWERQNVNVMTRPTSTSTNENDV